MMPHHDINNDMLISHPCYSCVYQEKSEKWELYQEIDNFWVGTPKQTAENAVHITPKIIKIWKKLSTKFLKEGMGVVGSFI